MGTRKKSKHQERSPTKPDTTVTGRHEGASLTTSFAYTSGSTESSKWNAGRLQLRILYQDPSTNCWEPLHIYGSQVHSNTYEHKGGKFTYDVATGYISSMEKACFAIELDYLGWYGKPRRTWALQSDQHLELEVSMDQSKTPDTVTGTLKPHFNIPIS